MTPPPARTRLDRAAGFIVQFVPDAITASVLLLIVLGVFAVSLGSSPANLTDAYYKGFWSLLPFTGQMTLIIVLGGAIAATPFFRLLVSTLARWPRTANQMVTLAVLLAAACSYCFWGLGYALSPLIAIAFAREAERRGLALHFPFFMATVYGANAVWQFGLSASAPLLVATPGHFLEGITGVIPLSRTIWSPAAILDVVLYTLAVICAGCVLMPKAARPISEFPDAVKLAELAPDPPKAPKTWSERLETQTWVTLVLCTAFAAWLWHHFVETRSGLNINSLNMVLFLLVFLLHGNVARIASALEKAVVSAWPVIILYHLYAGLAGVIEHTGVGEAMAHALTSASDPMTFPTLSAIIATVFSFFIPSSGGQWAIQGLVTAKTAMAVGVSVERGLLAMSVGDHMGNLTSPFWYVIVAGIARLDFRDFFGYGLAYAVIWFVIGALVFTFAPC
jgi:short-chain fatty acids transporter